MIRDAKMAQLIPYNKETKLKVFLRTCMYHLFLSWVDLEFIFH